MTVSEGGQVYQRLIGDFVDLARSDVSANRIRRHGHAERFADDARLNEVESAKKELLLSLSPDHRELVASMLEDARVRAFHDMLAYLEWKCTCDGLDIAVNGVAMAKSPFQETMHFCFVSRLEGGDWPQEATE